MMNKYIELKEPKSNSAKYIQEIKEMKELEIKNKFLKILLEEKNCRKFKEKIHKFYGSILFSEDFLESDIKVNSVINFARYFESLDSYFKPNETIIRVTQNQFISIIFSTTNSTNTCLDLTFKDDGLVDYFVYDKKYQADQVKAFIMRGYIETSDNFSKAYKIHRLLILIKYLNLEDKFLLSSSNSFESMFMRKSKYIEPDNIHDFKSIDYLK